jgi:hypothetical protein
MKNLTMKRLFALTAVVTLLVLGFTLASVPVQALASGISAQATVVVPTVAVTAVVPDTGGNTGAGTLWTSWIFWVIAGVILLAVVLSLIARAAAPPIDHTHHTDDL